MKSNIKNKHILIRLDENTYNKLFKVAVKEETTMAALGRKYIKKNLYQK